MPTTHAEFLKMQARCAPKVRQPEGAYDGHESELHEKILEYCESQGWLVCHSRMDRRSTVAVGMVDFIIAADGGLSYWVEAKRKGKKPTLEQLGTIAWAKKLGHIAGVVWSMQEFLDLINSKPSTESTT